MTTLPCQRCGSGRRQWLVTSEILRLEVCQDCAIEAREMKPYGRPALPGDMEIEPVEDGQ